ncbi:MAG: TadE/TadG family type IV pilus assembly protein [Candidatus Binataceae bacterium]
MTLRIAPKILRAYARGQSMTEFAGVALLFLILSFGIMQVSELVFAYNTVCEAAREGTRAAIVHGEGTGSANTISADKSAIQTAAMTAATNLGLSTADVTVTFPTDNKIPSGIDAKVVITYPYPFKLFSFILPKGANNTFTLTGTSQMPVSQ